MHSSMVRSRLSLPAYIVNNCYLAIENLKNYTRIWICEKNNFDTTFCKHDKEIKLKSTTY